MHNIFSVAKGIFYIPFKSKEDIVKERFLVLEFMFVNHVGYIMICRAYVTNLSECISGNSNHFERRDFSKIKPKSKVLDIGMGKGASLFPVIQKVGANGEVIGIGAAKACLVSPLKIGVSPIK